MIYKIILLLGYVGAMRRVDLYNLKSNALTDEGDKFKVSFYEEKNKRTRTFYVGRGDEDLNALGLLRKYIEKRMKVTNVPYFFVQWRNGAIHNQRVGIKAIGKVCQIVAQFHKISDWETYTSHGIRRSSATAMAEAGVPYLDIKKYVGWKGDNAAQGYIDQSTRAKMNVANAILGDPNDAGVSPQSVQISTNSVVKPGSNMLPHIHIGDNNNGVNINITFSN